MKNLGLLGKKMGMTRVFDENGMHVSVTVIDVTGNNIVGTRTQEKNSYTAVCLGYGLAKKEKRKSVLNNFAEKKCPKLVREFRMNEEELLAWKPGMAVLAQDIFKETKFLDVTGVTIGKGFQGVIRRYRMKGGPKSHGSTFHRTGGSVGQCVHPGRVIKGRKMPGRMGGNTVTVQNLPLVSIDEKSGILLVRGSVPGKRHCLLWLKSAVKKPAKKAA